MLKRWGLPLLVTMGLLLAIGGFAALAGPGDPSDDPSPALLASPEAGDANDADVPSDVAADNDQPDIDVADEAESADEVDNDVDEDDQGEDIDDDDQGEDIDDEVCEAGEVAVTEVEEDGEIEVECEDLDDIDEVDEVHDGDNGGEVDDEDAGEG